MSLAVTQHKLHGNFQVYISPWKKKYGPLTVGSQSPVLVEGLCVCVGGGGVVVELQTTHWGPSTRLVSPAQPLPCLGLSISTPPPPHPPTPTLPLDDSI